jgi:hypothetical protein
VQPVLQEQAVQAAEQVLLDLRAQLAQLVL